MYRHRIAAIALLASLLAATGRGELTFTADIYDTPGMPGYTTFDVSASSAYGELHAWSFLRGDTGSETGVQRDELGVFGPMHQLPLFEGGRVFSALPTDSGFLGEPLLSIGLDETMNSLNGLYGVPEPAAPGVSAPVVRVVTQDPSAVSFSSMAMTRNYDGPSHLGVAPNLRNYAVDFTMSDFLTAPSLSFNGGLAPVEPDPPVIPSPPPMVVPPPSSTPGDPYADALKFTADVYDTPGLPGFQTWDITASVVNDGLFGFAFGERGVAGSLHQSTGWGSGGVFSNSSDDSGFLAPNGVLLSLGLDESADHLAGMYGLEGGSQSSQPMLRVVTDDVGSVRINGMAYTDSGADRGQFPEFDFLLEDLLTGSLTVTEPEPAPPVVVAPPTPEPVAPTPPVVEPPVEIVLPPEPPAVDPPATPVGPEPPLPVVVTPPVEPPVVEPPAAPVVPEPVPPVAVAPPAIEEIVIDPAPVRPILWEPPAPPTREEHLASLERQLDYLPDNITRAEERLAEVAELRELAADEGFEPSWDLLPSGFFYTRYAIDGEEPNALVVEVLQLSLVDDGQPWPTDVWRPFVRPELTLEGFLARLDGIETSALASITWNEDEIARIEALIAEVLADPDFVPEWPGFWYLSDFVDTGFHQVEHTDVFTRGFTLNGDARLGSAAPVGFSQTSTPEPGGAALAALALAGGVLAGRRRSA